MAVNLRWLMLLLLAAVLTDAAAVARTPSQATTNPLSSMSWLDGDWISEVKVPAEGKPSAKTASSFRLMLRGRIMSISMAADGKAFMNGMFAYDGARKSIAFWYVVSSCSEEDDADDGTLAAGIVKSDQDALVLDFTGTRITGEVGHFRTRIEPIGTSQYRWQVFADYPGEGVQKLNEIVFTRQQRKLSSERSLK